MDNTGTVRVCKRCLLRDMENADAKMIEKYKASIKQEDRVTEAVYESRLAVCRECDRLNAGTCNACGCYVELRALAINGNCPYGHWGRRQ